MFNPIWLSKTCLGEFIVALLFIGIALGLVYHFAETDNGFVLLFDDCYSWAYGPTVGVFCIQQLLITKHGADRINRKSWLLSLVFGDKLTTGANAWVRGGNYEKDGYPRTSLYF